MKVEVGKKYRHFKGIICTVIAVAEHSETGETLVVYEHNNKVWARPYEMFTSKVDKDKYPDIKQEYRFELIND